MSPAQREKLLEHLRKGHFITSACKFVGISRDHYYDCRVDDPSFKDAADKALADSEEECLSAIRSDPAWQSKAWFLERRFAERWAKKPDVIAQAPGGTVSIALPADAAERASVLEALAEKARRGT